MDDFLQKLKKVVRIVLYGLAISQSGCRKAGLYQLPCNKGIYCLGLIDPSQQNSPAESSCELTSTLLIYGD